MKKLNHRRLAEGEVTGHVHEALEGTLYLDTDDTMVLDTAGTDVKHQEHTTVAIDAGRHRRLLVREVDEDEEIRNVID